ncbi:hypothetical protein EJ08DRAFT_703076 [Tothia fuscella]|uniref:Uncharacterized protein n=1 Tax=Tothia fuscella TaxID=1048955 RepID=A0A9P4NFG0_9PEZI|nr:hypothetical protein EJ08DRAFT_703076 [Tothia fuscella]
MLISILASAPNYRWFIPAEGIRRDVIEAHIELYLGPDALVKPGNNQDGVAGYWIAAYRTLTPSMIEDLRSDSANFERTDVTERYEDSEIHRSRHHWGPTQSISTAEVPSLSATQSYSSTSQPNQGYTSPFALRTPSTPSTLGDPSNSFGATQAAPDPMNPWSPGITRPPANDGDQANRTAQFNPYRGDPPPSHQPRGDEQYLSPPTNYRYDNASSYLPTNVTPYFPTNVTPRSSQQQSQPQQPSQPQQSSQPQQPSQMQPAPNQLSGPTAPQGQYLASDGNYYPNSSRS